MLQARRDVFVGVIGVAVAERWFYLGSEEESQISWGVSLGAL
jgi:hypothetical protein